MFKRNKKGFSLIEMLVVIAIIAVLVSIIVPTIGKATAKAAAATNAANMRAVKGQVTPMLLAGDFDYSTGRPSDEVIEKLRTNAALAKDRKDYGLVAALDAAIIALTIDVDDNLGLAGLVNNTYYAQDEKVTIAGLELTAPASEEVKIDGMALEEGVEMTISVTKNDVIVTYGGYTIEAFALIAEGGKGTDVENNSDAFNHTFVDTDGNGECDHCGKSELEHVVGDGVKDSWDDAVQDALSHVCVSGTGDMQCVCTVCYKTMHKDDEAYDTFLGSIKDVGNGVCDVCGECLNGYYDGRDRGSECDYCGKTQDEH